MINFTYLKILFLLLIALLDSIILLGQEANLQKIEDSLRGEFTKIKQSSFDVKKDTTLGLLYYDLGRKVYFRRANSDSLDHFVIEINRIAQKLNWEKGKYLANFLQASSYKINEQDFLATEFFLRSLILAEKLNDSKLIGNCYYELGSCYRFLKKYDNSINYYLKGIRIFKKNNNLHLEALSYNNLGLTYLDKGFLDGAINNLLIAQKLFIKEKNDFGIANIYENIGSIFFSKGEYQKAKTNFLIANQKFVKLKHQYFIANNGVLLSKVYLKQKSLKKALYYSTYSISIAKEYNYEPILLMGYLSQYEALKFLGKHKEALNIYEKYIVLKDKQNEATQEKKIELLKFEYENSKERAKNSLNRHEIILQKKNNRTLIIAIILFICLAIALFFINRVLQRQKKQIEYLNQNLEFKVSERTIELSKANDALERKNIEIQSSFLKGRSIERNRLASELHDNLGGHISAIRWSLMAIDKEKLNEKEKLIYENITEMINSTYDEVRFISHNLLPVEFEAKGIVEALKKLLFNLNFNPKIKFELQVESFAPLEKKIEFELYSILLELLNNILKHSNANLVQISFINHKIYQSIIISDNGKSFVNNFNLKNVGKGLNSIKERLNEVNSEIKYKHNTLGINNIEIKINK